MLVRDFTVTRSYITNKRLLDALILHSIIGLSIEFLEKYFLSLSRYTATTYASPGGGGLP